MKNSRRVWIWVVAIALVAASALAQVDTGAILGRSVTRAAASSPARP
jgi:hypothetical protein